MKTMHSIFKKTKDLFILLVLFSLTACGTLDVGIEYTPTPDQAGTATVSALTTENARLATQVAMQATPTPTPALGKLAYLQGGDIWVKALPAGEPLRLTTDGKNGEPRWSPSGEWLAFRKGEYGQIWVMRADGSDGYPMQTPPDAVFAWSPASDLLAYTHGDRLHIIHADGSEPLTLVAGLQEDPQATPPPEPQRIGRIAWSPDGSWIAYGWQKQQPDQPPTYQGLWKVSIQGEQPVELYASGVPAKGEAILAGWSPDGQYIFFWQGGILSASIQADGVPLYALPAGGGEPIQLVDTMLVHDDFLAPAPHNHRLAATAGDYRATWTNKRLAVVEASSGALTWLTDESVAAFSPTWSPEGNRLAYVAMPDEGDLGQGDPAQLGMMKRHIWLINADGSEPRQVTDDSAYRDERPLWSADGSYLLFARLDSENRASLWLIPVEGGTPEQMVDELTPAPAWFGYYGHIEWDQLFDWWCGPVVSQAPAAAIATPAQTLGPMATYTDTVIGCALDYPAGWYIEAHPGWHVIVTSFDPSGAPGQGGIPPEQTKIELLTDKPAQSLTLEQMVDQVRAQAEEVEILQEERWELPDSVPAERLQLKGQVSGETALLLTVINNHSLRLVGYGDLTHFDAIARTLRPISSAEVDSLEGAREVLIAFFSLLHAGRYSEAVNYYDGPYDVLRDNNPSAAPDDYAKLLEYGCTINGFQCLEVKEILSEEQISTAEFRFTVQFVNDDGTPFTQGPCCGATEEEMPPQSEFTYTVKKLGDRFLVMDLPVYVP